MNRGDRDKYIEILDGRLRKGRDINFLLPKHQPKPLDTPYDYLSIMHYTQYAFTKKRNCPTIKTKAKCAQNVIGKTKETSFYDAKAVNIMYRCNLHCQGDDYESWKKKGFGGCGSDPDCYLDRSCICTCPKKWQKDLRYLPSTEALSKFL